MFKRIKGGLQAPIFIDTAPQVAAQARNSPIGIAILARVDTRTFGADLLVPGRQLELSQGWHCISRALSGFGSCDTSSAPARPTTSQSFPFLFLRIRMVHEAEGAPVTPRPHVRPNLLPQLICLYHSAHLSRPPHLYCSRFPPSALRARAQRMIDTWMGKDKRRRIFRDGED